MCRYIHGAVASSSHYQFNDTLIYEDACHVFQEIVSLCPEQTLFNRKLRHHIPFTERSIKLFLVVQFPMQFFSITALFHVECSSFAAIGDLVLTIVCNYILRLTEGTAPAERCHFFIYFFKNLNKSDRLEYRQILVHSPDL